MDRETRQSLKTDSFQEEVFDIANWATHHKAKMIQGGIAILVIVVAIAGYRWYESGQRAERQDALAQALRFDDATVGADQPQPGSLHFATQQEKDQARNKALTDLYTKYKNTQEGSIAAMYLAVDASDKGNLPEAEKRFKEVVDNAPDAYAALARLSLAQVYEAEGKMDDAEKTLRDAINHPTSTVSKEQAQLTLARLVSKSKPDEARKLLDGLKDSKRGVISRNAITLLGELAQGQ